MEINPMSIIHCPHCAVGLVTRASDPLGSPICETCGKQFHRAQIDSHLLQWDAPSRELLGCLLEAAESLEWQGFNPRFELAIQPTFVSAVGKSLDGSGREVAYSPLPNHELQREHSDSDILTTLVGLDLHRWMKIPGWRHAIDWGLACLGSQEIVCKALAAWRDRYLGDVRVVDFVVFHLLGRFPCNIDNLHQWEASAIALAGRTHDASLVETLIYHLGERIRNYPEVWDAALALASNSQVRHALQERGLVPDEAHEARLHRDAEAATQNLFGAIRRHDVAAVRSLLSKAPDLTATYSDGQTAAQLARALGYEDLYQILCRDC